MIWGRYRNGSGPVLESFISRKHVTTESPIQSKQNYFFLYTSLSKQVGGHERIKKKDRKEKK